MFDISVYGEHNRIQELLNNLDEMKKVLKNDFKNIKVKFDNFAVLPVEFKARDVLLCSVHGDNESSVLFFIYADRNSDIRAYIPKQFHFTKKGNKFVVPKYSKETEKEIFDEKNLNKITEDFVGRTVVRNPKFNSKGEAVFPIDGTVTIKQLKDYVNRFGTELYPFVMKDLLQGNTHNPAVFYDVYQTNVEKYEVTSYNEISKENGKYHKSYAVMTVKLKEWKELYFFLYVDHKGALRAFMPIRGNNYNHRYCCALPEDRNSYPNLSKMAKEFDSYTVYSTDHNSDIIKTPLEELNGIPIIEQDKEELITVKPVKEKEILAVYDEATVKNKVKEMFNLDNVKVDNTITDKKKIHYGEPNVTYNGGTYCIVCKCTAKGYHPFYAVGYVDINDNFAVTIPSNNNTIYKNFPIKKNLTIPFKFTKDVECDIFEPMETTDDFEVYEVRHARMYGQKDLLSKVKKAFEGDYKEAVKKKDLRVDIENIIYNENVVEREDGLCYILMEADNCKVCFYLDTMNNLHLYVPYNKDYIRDLEETIIC